MKKSFLIILISFLFGSNLVFAQHFKLFPWNGNTIIASELCLYNDSSVYFKDYDKNLELISLNNFKKIKTTTTRGYKITVLVTGILAATASGIYLSSQVCSDGCGSYGLIIYPMAFIIGFAPVQFITLGLIHIPDWRPSLYIDGKDKDKLKKYSCNMSQINSIVENKSKFERNEKIFTQQKIEVHKFKANNPTSLGMMFDYGLTGYNLNILAKLIWTRSDLIFRKKRDKTSSSTTNRYLGGFYLGHQIIETDDWDPIKLNVGRLGFASGPKFNMSNKFYFTFINHLGFKYIINKKNSLGSKFLFDFTTNFGLSYQLKKNMSLGLLGYFDLNGFDYSPFGIVASISI